MVYNQPVSPVDVNERLAFLEKCGSNLIDSLGEADAEGGNDAPREYSDVLISHQVWVNALVVLTLIHF